MELPPLRDVIHELSGQYNRYKAGEITLQECRKSLSMPKGIFYHYLKEYIALQKAAIDQPDCEDSKGGKTMKKDFKALNPAMQFISKPAELEAQEEAEAKAEVPATNTATDDQAEEPEYKSRRLQLLIRPSIHAALKAEAKKKHTSVNDLINTILQEHIEVD